SGRGPPGRGPGAHRWHPPLPPACRSPCDARHTGVRDERTRWITAPPPGAGGRRRRVPGEAPRPGDAGTDSRAARARSARAPAARDGQPGLLPHRNGGGGHEARARLAPEPGALPFRVATRLEERLSLGLVLGQLAVQHRQRLTVTHAAHGRGVPETPVAEAPGLPEEALLEHPSGARGQPLLQLLAGRGEEVDACRIACRSEAVS